MASWTPRRIGGPMQRRSGAGACDPNAKLFLNESIVEFNATKRQELYDIVSSLVADHVPINGVGHEMHLFGGRPEEGVITDMVKAYRALGVEVAITEMDAFVNPNAANP